MGIIASASGIAENLVATTAWAAVVAAASLAVQTIRRAFVSASRDSMLEKLRSMLRAVGHGAPDTTVIVGIPPAGHEGPDEPQPPTSTTPQEEPDPSIVATLARIEAALAAQAGSGGRRIAKEFLLPLTVALIGISVPALTWVTRDTNTEKVDCPAYLAAVSKLAADTPDPANLKTLAGAWDGGPNAKACGGTPTAVLTAQGKLGP